MEQTRTTKKSIIIAIALGLVMVCVCVLTYKAKVESILDKPIYATWMSEHRFNGQVELNEANPTLAQKFLCTIPDLKQIRFQGIAQHVDDNAQMEITVVNVTSGETCFQKTYALKKILKKKKKMVTLKLKKKARESEGQSFVLTCKLINAGQSVVRITANQKQAVTESFNGNEHDKTNVIYAIRYGDSRELTGLFWIFCILLIGMVEWGHYLIGIRGLQIQNCYVPLAIVFGIVFGIVIMIQGVPDEPTHLDTAYKYSNKILFAGTPEQEGTIYKRKCDVLQTDMLANGVESNSYYQLLHHTFERPENTELMVVNYADSSNLVPGFVFVPAAIGISIGRLLGLSTILVLFLGRMCNLLTFVLLTGLAIKIIPVGKNVIGALGMLPITLQQAASASYDAMINGCIFLFIALCIRFSQKVERKKWQIVVLIMISILLAVVKGGVYLPVLLILLLYREGTDRSAHKMNRISSSLTKHKKWLWLVIAIFGVGLVILLLLRYLPTIMSLMSISTVSKTGDGETLYSIGYIIRHPLQLLYLYWNTIVDVGDNHFSGFLGGRLAWYDVKCSWLLLIGLFICMLLLVNVEKDQYQGGKKEKGIMLTAAGMSIFLIMLSMVFACTTVGSTYIFGLQGRYCLAIAPLMLMSMSNRMISVNSVQCRKIWMAMIVLDTLVLLQFIVQVV